MLRRPIKHPGTVKFALQAIICDDIVSWASTWRGTLKQSSKTCSAGRKTPSYSQKRAINYALRRNRLLGFNVSRYTETVLENVIRRSINPQVQTKTSYKLWFATKSSPGQQRVKVHRNSPRNVLSGSRNPQVQSKPSHKQCFATKSTPGLQRVEIH